MPETLRGAALAVATMTMGLSAGLFYAFAIAVMPGLARTGSRTYVEAMQQVNVAILNGWFMLIFLGAPMLTALVAVLHLPTETRAALPWIVAALAFSIVALVITFWINVPLNDALAAAGSPDRIADHAAVRDEFETTWVRWNIVRAVVDTIAFGLLTWALLLSTWAR